MIVSYALLIIWAGVIFMLSSEGSDTSSGRSDAVVQTVRSWGVGSDSETDVLTFLVRKSAHITAYFIFGVLAYNVVRLYSLSRAKKLLVSIGLVVAYAMSDEFHQLFVPGRSAELRDVLIDSVAGVVGVLLCYLVVQWASAKSTKQLPKNRVQ